MVPVIQEMGKLSPNPPLYLERVMGIEPTSSAWEAEVLPLNHTRKCCGSR